MSLLGNLFNRIFKPTPTQQSGGGSKSYQAGLNPSPIIGGDPWDEERRRKEEEARIRKEQAEQERKAREAERARVAAEAKAKQEQAITNKQTQPKSLLTQPQQFNGTLQRRGSNYQPNPMLNNRNPVLKQPTIKRDSATLAEQNKLIKQLQTEKQDLSRLGLSQSQTKYLTDAADQTINNITQKRGQKGWQEDKNLGGSFQSYQNRLTETQDAINLFNKVYEKTGDRNQAISALNRYLDSRVDVVNTKDKWKNDLNLLEKASVKGVSSAKGALTGIGNVVHSGAAGVLEGISNIGDLVGSDYLKKVGAKAAESTRRDLADIERQLGLDYNPDIDSEKLYGLGQGATKLARDISMTSVGLGGLVAADTAFNVANETYSELREQGKGKFESLGKAVTNAAAQAIVERANLGDLVATNNMKPLVASIIGALSEGSEEGIQRLTDNLFKGHPLMEGVADDFGGGVVLGGGTSAVNAKLGEIGRRLNSQIDAQYDPSTHPRENAQLKAEVSAQLNRNIDEIKFALSASDPKKQGEFDTGLVSPNQRQEVEVRQEQALGTTPLYRGLTQEFDPNYDLARTDAPYGYSTYTNNPLLAREYAGQDGYVYRYDAPKQALGNELVNSDGERALFVNNGKPASLNGVSGDEYLVYNQHELYSPDNVRLDSGPQQQTDNLGNQILMSDVKNAQEVGTPIIRGDSLVDTEAQQAEQNAEQLAREQFEVDKSLVDLYNEAYGKEESSNQFGQFARANEGQTLERTDPSRAGQGSGYNIGTNLSALEKFIKSHPDGFTVSLNGQPVTDGYAVSPYKGREVVLDYVDGNSLKEFISKNEDLLYTSNHHLGGWLNPDDGKFYLDVSVVPKDINEAIRIAALNDQIAIFDIAGGESINTRDFLNTKLKDSKYLITNADLKKNGAYDSLRKHIEYLIESRKRLIADGKSENYHQIKKIDQSLDMALAEERRVIKEIVNNDRQNADFRQSELNRILGDDIRVVLERVGGIPQNAQGFAQFKEGVIGVLDGKMSTGYHESSHIVVDYLKSTNNNLATQALNNVIETQGAESLIAKLRADGYEQTLGRSFNVNNQADVQYAAEEYLANEFAEYAAAKSAGQEANFAKQRGLSERIKAWFDQVYERLRYFTGQMDAAEQFMYQTERGDFANQIGKARRDSVGQDSKYLIGGEKAKNYQDAVNAGRDFIGPDGKKRFEIDDSGMEYTDNLKNMIKDIGKSRRKRSANLGELIKHDNLFKSYPDVANVPVELSYGDNRHMGRYAQPLKTQNESFMFNTKYVDGGGDRFRGTILHEINHALQAREGYAKGKYIKNKDQLVNEKYDLTQKRQEAAKRFHESTSFQERETIRKEVGIMDKRIRTINSKLSQSPDYERYKSGLEEVESDTVGNRANMTQAERDANPFFSEGTLSKPLKDVLINDVRYGEMEQVHTSPKISEKAPSPKNVVAPLKPTNPKNGPVEQITPPSELKPVETKPKKVEPAPVKKAEPKKVITEPKPLKKAEPKKTTKPAAPRVRAELDKSLNETALGDVKDTRKALGIATKRDVNISEIQTKANQIVAATEDADLVKRYQNGIVIATPQQFFETTAAIKRLGVLDSSNKTNATALTNAIESLTQFGSNAGQDLRIVKELYKDMPPAMRRSYIIDKMNRKLGSEMTPEQRETVTRMITKADGIQMNIDKIQADLDKITNGMPVGIKYDRDQASEMVKSLKNLETERDYLQGDIYTYVQNILPKGNRATRLVQASKTSLLASPLRRANDIFATKFTQVSDVGAEAISGLIGRGLNKLTGNKGKFRELRVGDLGKLVKGDWQGTKEGFSDVKTGRRRVSNLTAEVGQATRADSQGRRQTRGGKAVSAFTEAATKMTEGQQDMRLNQLARQEGQKLGLKGEMLDDYTMIRSAVPTPDQLYDAQQFHARTNSLHKNAVTQAVNTLAKSIEKTHPQVGPLVSFVVAPFKSWQAGTLHRALTDKNLLGNVYSVIKGITKKDPQMVIDATGKGAVNATEAFVIGMLLSKAGLISDEDDNEETWSAPYLNIAGRKIPITFFGPGGMNIALGHNLRNSVGKGPKGLSDFVEKTHNQILNYAGASNMLGGENPLQTLIQSPRQNDSFEKRVTESASNTLRMFTPASALLADTNAFLNTSKQLNPTGERAKTKATKIVENPDGTTKEVKDTLQTELNRLQNQIPFLSQALPRDEGKVVKDPIDRVTGGTHSTDFTKQAHEEKVNAEIAKKQQDARDKSYRQNNTPDINNAGGKEAYQIALENGNWDTAIRAKEWALERKGDSGELSQKTKSNYENDIKELKILKDNNYSYETYNQYHASEGDGGVTLSAWRKMIDPESEEYNIELATKLAEYDQRLLEAGIIKKLKYTPAKSSGGGSRSKSLSLGSVGFTGYSPLKEVAKMAYKKIPSSDSGSTIPVLKRVPDYDTSKLNKISVKKGVV